MINHKEQGAAPEQEEPDIMETGDPLPPPDDWRGSGADLREIAERIRPDTVTRFLEEFAKGDRHRIQALEARVAALEDRIAELEPRGRGRPRDIADDVAVSIESHMREAIELVLRDLPDERRALLDALSAVVRASMRAAVSLRLGSSSPTEQHNEAAKKSRRRRRNEV